MDTNCGEGEDDKLRFFNSKGLDEQLASEVVFALGLAEDHGEMEVGKLVAKLANDAEAKMVSYEDLIFKGMSDFNKVETIIRYLNSKWG